MGISFKVLGAMFDFFDGDVIRVNHALKVYGFAENIGLAEKISDEKLEIVKISAILHDVGIKISEEKYNSSAGHLQELEGPAIAKDILSKFDLEPSFIERVCFLIKHHHTYTKIDDIDYQILVEADFLVNIHENNMDDSMINNVLTKYFKTATGIKFLKSIY